MAEWLTSLAITFSEFWYAVRGVAESNNLLILGLLLVGFKSTQRPCWFGTSIAFYVGLDPINWLRHLTLVLYIGLLYARRYVNHSFGVIQSFSHYCFYL